MEKKVFIKFVIFIVIFIIIGFIYTKILEIKINSQPYFVEHAAQYKLTKDSLDGAIFGSSVVQNSMLYLELYNTSGLKFLSFASTGEPIQITYYKIKEMYKNFSPEVIIVDLYLNHKEREYEIGDRFSLDMMKMNFNKIGAINSVTRDFDVQLELVFKILYYHSNWKDIISCINANSKKYKFQTLLAESSLIFSLENKSIENDVYNYEEIINEINKTNDEEITKIIGDNVSEYFYKIIDLAKENDTKVIFTCLPKCGDYWESYVFELLRKKYEYEKNITFLNFANDLIEFDYSKDFVDVNHLNYLGAQKVTKYLAEYLEKKYKFVKKDTDEQIWKESYDEYIYYLQNVAFVEWENDIGSFNDIYIEYN